MNIKPLVVKSNSEREEDLEAYKKFSGEYATEANTKESSLGLHTFCTQNSLNQRLKHHDL